MKREKQWVRVITITIIIITITIIIITITIIIIITLSYLLPSLPL